MKRIFPSIRISCLLALKDRLFHLVIKPILSSGDLAAFLCSFFKKRWRVESAWAWRRGKGPAFHNDDPSPIFYTLRNSHITMPFPKYSSLGFWGITFKMNHVVCFNSKILFFEKWYAKLFTITGKMVTFNKESYGSHIIRFRILSWKAKTIFLMCLNTYLTSLEVNI